jgi:hypothetical protein
VDACLVAAPKIFSSAHPHIRNWSDSGQKIGGRPYSRYVPAADICSAANDVRDCMGYSITVSARASSVGVDIDNHGTLTICLHAGGNPAIVKTGFGLRGGGCSVDSLNQKLSSLLQPSLGRGEAGGLHSALSAGQAIWT